MWQKRFEKYQKMGFTVVGLALDQEGIEPAKLYYEKYGVTFPALVDPNYATGFGAVPKTFFIDDKGVVQLLADWEQRLKPADELEPVAEQIRAQWSKPGERLEPSAIARLVAEHIADPSDLATATELASRYLDLQLATEARAVLEETIARYNAKETAASGDRDEAQLLGQAYWQLSRSSVGDRDAQVEHATQSFYLDPSVGKGKQIARIIAPEKFDHRPGGDFDNVFREATLRRLVRDRQAWLKGQ